jgi:hypothetical protein
MSDSLTAPRDTIALDNAIADTRRIMDTIIKHPEGFFNPEGELIAQFRQLRGYVATRATA